jgi:hypothetical protein
VKRGIFPAALLLVLPWCAFADVEVAVIPLPCGIYDEATRPLVQRALETQSRDRARYTMEVSTTGGRRLRVEVVNVAIALPGERNQVTVFLDDKPLAKTSHQDVPLYLEVYVDEAKYRIICVRAHKDDAGADLMSGEIPSTVPSAPARTAAGMPGQSPGLQTKSAGTAPVLP